MDKPSSLKNRLDFVLYKQQNCDKAQLFESLIDEFNEEINSSIELVALLGVIEEFYSDKIPLDTLIDFMQSGSGK